MDALFDQKDSEDLEWYVLISRIFLNYELTLSLRLYFNGILKVSNCLLNKKINFHVARLLLCMPPFLFLFVTANK